jgi:Zn-dependent metalloprotease
MKLHTRLTWLLCVAGGSLGFAATATAATGDALKQADAPQAQLDRVSSTVLPGRGGIVYRYQQEVEGVPVLDAQAVIHDVVGAAPALVADGTERSVPAPPSAGIAKPAAIRRAVAATSTRRLDGRTRAQLAVAPDEGDALVWRVTIPAARPLGDYEVLVDARTGAVLRQRNMIQDAVAQAMVFDPNAVVANDGYAGIGRKPSADHHDRNTAKLTSLRTPVTLDHLRKSGRCLRGKWAIVKLGRQHKKVCQSSLNWNGVKRASNRFEAVMSYFHVDRTQQYIQDLGFTDANAEPQVLKPDAIRDDNSFYRPSVDTITYGTGGVDDAEDADVIVHEYGHAIQDDQVPHFGQGFQAGAIGEGFGDYMAASQTQHNGGSTEEVRCIFDWDGVGGWGDPPPVPCGRRADDPRTFHQAQLGIGNSGNYCNGAEIHCAGQVWASSLIDIRTGLGSETQGQKFDKDLISSQFDYLPTETFQQAAESLIDADQALNGGSFVAEICTEMQDHRGLTLTGCI